MKISLSSIPVIFILVLFLLPVPILGSNATRSTALSSTANSNHVQPRSQIDINREQFPTKLVNVYLGYNSEPAPMGIADYGVNQSGAYEYSTSSFLGVVTVNSLSTQDKAGDSSMGFQLNINLVFQTSATQQYVYWVQDVAQLNTSTNTISMIDNVWNVSSTTATLTKTGISGNGKVEPDTRKLSFYYDQVSPAMPGNDVTYSFPMTLQLRMNSTESSLGQPQVTFEYNDGFGWQLYDKVTFPLVKHPSADNGFLVSGLSYEPIGGFYDAELIMGGPGGGTNATIISSGVQMSLQFFNGHNYQQVYNAYNFGSDTAEGISNAVSEQLVSDQNGSLSADISPGAGTLGALYYRSQIGILNVQASVESGTLYVVNASFPSGASNGVGYPFVGGDANLTLSPGTYNLYLNNSGGTQVSSQMGVTLAAGQYLSLNMNGGNSTSSTTSTTTTSSPATSFTTTTSTPTTTSTTISTTPSTTSTTSTSTTTFSTTLSTTSTSTSSSSASASSSTSSSTTSTISSSSTISTTSSQTLTTTSSTTTSTTSYPSPSTTSSSTTSTSITSSSTALSSTSTTTSVAPTTTSITTTTNAAPTSTVASSTTSTSSTSSTSSPPTLTTTSLSSSSEASTTSSPQSSTTTSSITTISTPVSTTTLTSSTTQTRSPSGGNPVSLIAVLAIVAVIIAAMATILSLRRKNAGNK